MSCEHIERCIFFNDKMAEMPGMSEIYKNRYCRDDNLACARYIVCDALGREGVPGDLYPNDRDRALALIA